MTDAPYTIAMVTIEPAATAATMRSRSGTLAKRQPRLYSPNFRLAVMRTPTSTSTIGRNGRNRSEPIALSYRSARARYAAEMIPARSTTRRCRPRMRPTKRMTIARTGGTRPGRPSVPVSERCVSAGPARYAGGAWRRTVNGKPPSSAVLPGKRVSNRPRDRGGTVALSCLLAGAETTLTMYCYCRGWLRRNNAPMGPDEWMSPRDR